MSGRPPEQVKVCPHCQARVVFENGSLAEHRRQGMTWPQPTCDQLAKQEKAEKDLFAKKGLAA